MKRPFLSAATAVVILAVSPVEAAHAAAVGRMGAWYSPEPPAD